ncbi:toll/interleukin-1 receptor domain-containing protein [Corallococcus interemptor]|nr:toll/interleukin-1 receptor domain-containing protein [Corallococcus interemptor]
MSPRPRIFISHSTRDPVGKTYRDALVERLKAADFPYLLDEDIDLSKEWRSTLNAWIGGCDAAVLLLSEAALISSHVAYETSLLAYRHRSEQGRFQLLTIFVPPVTGEQVGQSALGPTGIAEIQALRRDASMEQALQRVMEALEQHNRSLSSPAELHAKRLANLLMDVPEGELKVARQAVAGDVPHPWAPGLDLPLHVALNFMEWGLERAPTGIRRIRTYLAKPHGIDEAVMLLATAWVDCRSIEEIRAVVKSRGRLLALRGEKCETARLYVVSACDIRPNDAWHVAIVDGVVGNRAAEELKQLVRDALKQVLSTETASAEEIHEVLDLITGEGEPVFVAMRSTGLNLSMLQELQKEFPEVTFFFLTRSDDDKQQLAKQADIELLHADIEPGTEQSFWNLFQRKLQYLKKHSHP